jgi:hypothetical protein
MYLRTVWQRANYGNLHGDRAVIDLDITKKFVALGNTTRNTWIAKHRATVQGVEPNVELVTIKIVAIGNIPAGQDHAIGLHRDPKLKRVIHGQKLGLFVEPA